MKIWDQLNFILISKKASSLYSLIADGQYRPTELGRYMWKTLIGSQASLQLNCNKEGSTRRGPILVLHQSEPQESVSLETTATIVRWLTPESGLVLEKVIMTQTREETRPCGEITATNTSKPWGTALFSDNQQFKELKFACLPAKAILKQLCDPSIKQMILV